MTDTSGPYSSHIVVAHGGDGSLPNSRNRALVKTFGVAMCTSSAAQNQRARPATHCGDPSVSASLTLSRREVAVMSLPSSDGEVALHTGVQSKAAHSPGR